MSALCNLLEGIQPCELCGKPKYYLFYDYSYCKHDGFCWPLLALFWQHVKDLAKTD